MTQPPDPLSAWLWAHGVDPLALVLALAAACSVLGCLCLVQLSRRWTR